MLDRRVFLKKATGGVSTIICYPLLSSLHCASESSDMPKRLLGRTGLSVSLLGFGCTQVKDKAVYRRAIELGVNYFHLGDRDPAYNLEACSVLLPQRKKINIAYMSHPKDSRAILMEDLDNFLYQSGFGHLDMWFVITPRPEVLSEFCEAVTLAREAGKIRWAGITTHSLDRDVELLTGVESPIGAVMMAYNYLSPPEHRAVLDRLHRAGLGITPMKPLAGRFYEQTANKPDALIRWLAADQRISTIPVIMTTTEQVEQNAAAVEQPLSEEDNETLRVLTAYNSERFCRMCGDCSGKCPEGLAVSDLIRTAMYAEGYRDLHMARTTYFAIAEKNRRISCTRCEQCSIDCPNGVNIKDRISKIEGLLA